MDPFKQYIGTIEYDANFYGIVVAIAAVLITMDHAVSKSAKVIQSQLEREVNTLRVTQAGRLESISASGDKVFLGHKGKDFQFSDLKSVKVDFVECSALEDGSTDSLKPWLMKIA
ncbi:unnamed protein product [Larinioides sclopetarius]|uniref:Signal recognition particle receptor subunit beta n=1 Tax=Larinioides sclopetarius TaxID=280406 RepID=A0AAV2BNI5_9ARAC